MTARPLSISLRLGLLFSAIATTVFLAVGAYLYQTLSHQMGRRDDIDLLNKAVLVRQLVHGLQPGDELPRQLHGVISRVIGEDGVMLQVATPAGEVLAGRAIRLAVMPAPVPLGRDPALSDIIDDAGHGGPKRLLSVLASSANGDVKMTLVRMRSDRLAVLKRYVADLLGALLSGALLATALAFLAVRRGLRPLYGVVAKANEINAQRLNTRLAIDDVPSELRELSASFNAMLDRLEDGVQRLSGFAADLAHDMRTPVNALMMQTQVALSRERSTEEYQALLASTQDEYERLSRMIENTLFLARADSAQLALTRDTLDLHAELAHIRDYFDILAEDKGITLEVAEFAPLVLNADPVLLRRAVNNLVSNAIAHTPSGGFIRLNATADDQWFKVSVLNTGAGIGQEHLDHVFDRYYRADSARAATSSAGLGLAIVRAIMQLHGGSADVESCGGGQTTFTLRFPRHSACHAEL